MNSLLSQITSLMSIKCSCLTTTSSYIFRNLPNYFIHGYWWDLWTGEWSSWVRIWKQSLYPLAAASWRPPSDLTDIRVTNIIRGFHLAWSHSHSLLRKSSSTITFFLQRCHEQNDRMCADGTICVFIIDTSQVMQWLISMPHKQCRYQIIMVLVKCNSWYRL